MILLHSCGDESPGLLEPQALASVKASFGKVPVAPWSSGTSRPLCGDSMLAGIEPDAAIVLTSADSVFVYGSDKTCLKTWTTSRTGPKKAAKRLRGSAKLIPGTSTLAAITDKGSLLTWDFFSDSLVLRIDTAKKLGREEISDIFTSSYLSGDLIVIFCNGAVSIRSFDADGSVQRDVKSGTMHERKIAQQGGKVLFSDLIEVDRRAKHWRVILTEVLEDGKARVRCVELIDGKLTSGASYASPMKELPCAVVAHNGELVTMLWENGASHVLLFNKLGKADVISEMRLNIGSGRKLGSENDHSKPENSELESTFRESQAVSLRDNQTVFLYAHGNHAEAWDSQMGIKIADIETNAPIAHIIYNLRYSVAVLSLKNGEVVVEDCSPASESSLALVGSISTLAGALRHSIMLEEEANIDEAESHSRNESGLGLTSCPQINKIGKNSTFTQSYFKRKIADSEDKVNRALASLEDIKTKKAKHDVDLAALERLCRASASTDLAMDECLSSNDWKRLEILIRSRGTSLTANSRMVPCLLKHNKLKLLYLSLSHMSGFEESVVVSIIRYILCDAPQRELEEFCEWIEARLSNFGNSNLKLIEDPKKDLPAWCEWKSHDMKDSKNMDKGVARAWQRSCCKLVDILKSLDIATRGVHYFSMSIMCLPFNNQFLVNACKLLTADEIKVLIRCMATVLLHYSGQPAKDYIVDKKISKQGLREILIPTFGQALSFAGTTIDASFFTLSRSCDRRTLKFLKTILKIVQDHANVCATTQLMKTSHSCCSGEGSRRSVNNVSDYYVETIKL